MRWLSVWTIPSDTTTTRAFLAGALLPTIAFYFWTTVRSSSSKNQQRRQQRIVGDNDDNDNEEYDDDDDEDEEEDEDLFENVEVTPDSQLSVSQWGMKDAPYKMLLIVNQELGMGKGKIAAQCGHAAVGCYQRALRACPDAVRAWERTGCAKIAVKCPTTLDLEQLAAKAAQSSGIPQYLVEDAGRTQIAAGSRTVLGLFGPTHVFDGFTDHLKLM